MKQHRLLKRLLGMALLCLSFTWAVAQPSNDNCSGAVNVSCGGTYSGTLVGATNSYPSGFPDVWYRLANASGQVTVSLCNSSPANWDSYLYVRRLSSGQSDCTTSILVGSDDDGCGTNALSKYTFTANPSEVYYISVADFSNPAPPSNFALTVSCTPTTPPPGNDLCGNATAVTCGSSTAGTTINAGADPGFSSPGVWYTVQGTGNPIVVATCGASFPSTINVLTGTCGIQTFVTPTSTVACTNGSTVTFPTVLGTTYYVLVNGSNNLAGNFTLTVQCPNPTPTPPINDYCTGAISVTCPQTINGTTNGATPEAFGGSPTVWYTMVGNGQLVTASLCGNNVFDSYIRVLKLAPGAISCVTGPFYGAGSNDDFCGQDAQVTWWAEPGAIYYIVVSGALPANFGDFKLDISCDPDGIPNNDLCLGAYPVSCGGDYSGTTVGATFDAQPGTIGVWYELTAGDAGTYTASLCGGASWDTYLYSTIDPCETPNNWFPNNDDFCRLQSQISFFMNAGSKRRIVVGGYQGATGFFTLKITGPCVDGKTAGVPEYEAKPGTSLKVLVAPNPSTDFTEFALSTVETGAAELRILDLTGKVVAVKSLGELESGEHQFRHDWNGVPAGIYLYQVTVGKQQANGKLQVVH